VPLDQKQLRVFFESLVFWFVVILMIYLTRRASH
jgi:hypothetical protein